MKELNTSSTDAMQWAECLAERIDSGITPDADFLVGWFANYWAAVYDPLKAALEAAEAREAELRARVAELEGMVQKPFGPIKHPNACLVCGAIHGHGGLQCPSYLVSLECAL